MRSMAGGKVAEAEEKKAGAESAVSQEHKKETRLGASARCAMDVALVDLLKSLAPRVDGDASANAGDKPKKASERRAARRVAAAEAGDAVHGRGGEEACAWNAEA